MTASSPHLGLDDLIAGLDDAPMDAAAQGHLYSCPACLAEAARWRAVADGVRMLVGSSAPPPWRSVDIFSAPGGPAARPRHRSRIPLPHTAWGRGLLSVCAALLALLIAAVFAFGAARSGGPAASVVASPVPPIRESAGPGRLPGSLSAVPGCAGLDQAAGTLTAVNGTDLVLTTPAGQSLTVRTNASTSVLRQLTGQVSDIANGDRAAVEGTEANGAIPAGAVGLAPGDSASVPIPEVDANASTSGAAGIVSTVTSGTVADAHDGGFTLVLTNGEEIPVTTPASTPVVVQTDSDLQGLQVGDFTAAVGGLDSSGTLIADSVDQDGVAPGAQPSPAGASPSSPSGVSVPGAISRYGGVIGLAGARCSSAALAASALFTDR